METNSWSKIINLKCFFVMITVTILGSSLLSSTLYQQTFPCFTQGLVWMALGDTKISPILFSGNFFQKKPFLFLWSLPLGRCGLCGALAVTARTSSDMTSREESPRWGLKLGLNHSSIVFASRYLVRLKSKEPPQTFVPKILVSWYPEWANCKGFLEPKSVNLTKS